MINLSKEDLQVIAHELDRLQQERGANKQTPPSETTAKHDAKQPPQRASAIFEKPKTAKRDRDNFPRIAKNVAKWGIIGFYVVWLVILLIYLKQYLFV